MRPPIDNEALSGLQGVSGTSWSLEVLPEVTSTNTLLAERAKLGEPAGRVLVAEVQTQGRGRLNRDWIAPAGGCLTVSFLLRPQRPASDWSWLPLLTGVALVETADRFGVEAGLKWPNDVLVGERKLAGVLVERVEAKAGPSAVIGVGLNVDLTEAELPLPSATSLALCGAQADRSAVLRVLVERLDAHLAQWEADPGAIRAVYPGHCLTLGQDVVAHLPGDRERRGTALRIGEDGSLVIEVDGVTETVSAGDVVHVRPAAP